MVTNFDELWSQKEFSGTLPHHCAKGAMSYHQFEVTFGRFQLTDHCPAYFFPTRPTKPDMLIICASINLKLKSDMQHSLNLELVRL